MKLCVLFRRCGALPVGAVSGGDYRAEHLACRTRQRIRVATRGGIAQTPQRALSSVILRCFLFIYSLVFGGLCSFDFLSFLAPLLSCLLVNTLPFLSGSLLGFLSLGPLRVLAYRVWCVSQYLGRSVWWTGLSTGS